MKLNIFAEWKKRKGDGKAQEEDGKAKVMFITFQLENSLSCLTNSQSSRFKRPFDGSITKSSLVQLLNRKPILQQKSPTLDFPKKC